MCTVWHVDKYKITFKLVINSRRFPSRPGIIDARARYRVEAGRLINIDIYHCCVYSEKLLMMDGGTARNM